MVATRTFITTNISAVEAGLQVGIDARRMTGRRIVTGVGAGVARRDARGADQLSDAITTSTRAEVGPGRASGRLDDEFLEAGQGRRNKGGHKSASSQKAAAKEETQKTLVVLTVIGTQSENGRMMPRRQTNDFIDGAGRRTTAEGASVAATRRPPGVIMTVSAARQCLLLISQSSQLLTARVASCCMRRLNHVTSRGRIAPEARRRRHWTGGEASSRRHE